MVSKSLKWLFKSGFNWGAIVVLGCLLSIVIAGFLCSCEGSSD